MHGDTRAGRTVGALILLQMAGSGVVNGPLVAPLRAPEGILDQASAHATQLGLAALVGVGTEALWLGMAITLAALLWPGARALALWLLALATASVAAAMLESATLMSLVSLSQSYAHAAPDSRVHLAAVHVVATAAHDWAHLLARLLNGATIGVLYLALYRTRLVPRVLPAIGFGCVALMLGSLARPFFGPDVLFALLAPVGLSQLALSLWLLVRGFRVASTPGVAAASPAPLRGGP